MTFNLLKRNVVYKWKDNGTNKGAKVLKSSGYSVFDL